MKALLESQNLLQKQTQTRNEDLLLKLTTLETSLNTFNTQLTSDLSLKLDASALDHFKNDNKALLDKALDD